jgi:hypothetical protein
MFAEGAILGVPLELLSWGIRGSINKFSKKNLDENTVDIATKEINDIKILSDNKIITLTSRLEEINKLKKQLKEIKDIKPKIKFEVNDVVNIDANGTKATINKKFFINNALSKNIDDTDKYIIQL